MTNQEKLSLYTSIFRGRTDVYPRRWEKGDKSGWTPAYSFDWNDFNAHRARGGTMKETVKTVRVSIAKKDTKAVKTELSLAFKALDKAAKRGVIKKGTANRKKSRLAKALAKTEKK